MKSIESVIQDMNTNNFRGTVRIDGSEQPAIEVIVIENEAQARELIERDRLDRNRNEQPIRERSRDDSVAGPQPKHSLTASLLRKPFEELLKKLQNKRKELRERERDEMDESDSDAGLLKPKKSKKKTARTTAKPMNVSAIRAKLRSLTYTNVWQIVDDLWTAFEVSSDCPETQAVPTRVLRSGPSVRSTVFGDFFANEIDQLMLGFGYCCGRKLMFKPSVKFCSSSECCLIVKDAIYYKCSVPLDNRSTQHFEYYSCKNCFEKNTTSTVHVTGFGPTQQLKLNKDRFEKVKNNVPVPEPKTECGNCKRLFHSICVNYSIRLSTKYDYLCKKCEHDMQIKRPIAQPSSISIRETPISIHIEQRINLFLRTREQTAKLREPARQYEPFGRVRVRLVVNEQRDRTTKLYTSQRYGSDTDTYTMKTIVVFQSVKRTGRTDGRTVRRNFESDSEDEDFELTDPNAGDVCFFALQVQEYTGCNSGPNDKRVYISYLDSVRLFQPAEYRTAVYHEIILAYLGYVQRQGYKSVHIWACPPQTTIDDYIFYRHPPDQKIPDPARLQHWYADMLNLGKKRGIFTDVSNLYDWSVRNQITDIRQLPMFDGDYWPTHLEDTLTKHAKKKTVNERKLFGEIHESMKKFGDAFLVGQFAVDGGRTTIDTSDPAVKNALFDSRENVLRFFRQNNLESSSLRRALHTTNELIDAIITHGSYPTRYLCNACTNYIEFGQHCPLCNDYDLCDRCYENVGGHVHATEVIMADVMLHGSIMTNADGRDFTQKDDRLFDLWYHAMFCSGDTCPNKYCATIRDKLVHFERCALKQDGHCGDCLRVEVMWLSHTIKCKDKTCTKQCRDAKLELNDVAIRRRRTAIRRKYMTGEIQLGSQREQTPESFFAERVAAMEASS